ncbi:hypothetical protein DER30_5644 [Streptomyces sp. HB202]|nr:hypothetical protein DER30_5644 [Streptomyces sp. HB202]
MQGSRPSDAEHPQETAPGPHRDAAHRRRLRRTPSDSGHRTGLARHQELPLLRPEPQRREPRGGGPPGHRLLLRQRAARVPEPRPLDQQEGRGGVGGAVRPPAERLGRVLVAPRQHVRDDRAVRQPAVHGHLRGQARLSAVPDPFRRRPRYHLRPLAGGARHRARGQRLRSAHPPRGGRLPARRSGRAGPVSRPAHRHRRHEPPERRPVPGAGHGGRPRLCPAAAGPAPYGRGIRYGRGAGGLGGRSGTPYGRGARRGRPRPDVLRPLLAGAAAGGPLSRGSSLPGPGGSAGSAGSPPPYSGRPDCAVRWRRASTPGRICWGGPWARTAPRTC